MSARPYRPARQQFRHGAALRKPLVAAVVAMAMHAVASARDNPLGGGETVTLEPVPERTTPRAPISRRRVFTCVAPDLVIFSDRPCGPLPEQREVHFAAGAAATPPAAGSAASASRARESSARRDQPGSVAPGRAAAAPREDAAEREARERATSCARLEQAVDELDQRLRAGYSAREAGRLWARWREARERLRDARC